MNVFDLPMVEFYKRFSIDDKEISENVKLKDKKVVVCSPSYRWPNDHENYYNYCKFQLIKWNPNEEGYPPENCEDEKEYWKQKWEAFKNQNCDTAFEQLFEEMMD